MLTSILIIVVILLFVSIIAPLRREKVIEGLNTFNGRMAVDDQYHFDKLFDDVSYYPNEYEKNYSSEEEIGKLLMTGWAQCRARCPGNCVEYGVHGHSYCFYK